MYAQDYDERHVWYYRYYYTPVRELFWWGDLLQPYSKNYQLLECPTEAWPYTYLRPVGLPNPLICSYALPNITHDINGNGCLRVPGEKMANIRDPAGTIIMVDSTSSEIYTGGTANYTLAGPNGVTDLGTGTVRRVPKRHNDGFNLGFCDGHAKWLKQTLPGMWTVTSGD